MNTSTSLQNLHDIVVPTPPSWFPPAPGWYALGFTVLILLGFLLLRWYRHYQRNRYRRLALYELDQLQKQWRENQPPARWLPQLPVLIKRTALAAYGRQQVAALSGQQWLDFLDRTAGKTRFNNASGQRLLAYSYAPLTSIQADQQHIQELFSLCRSWLLKHRLPAEN